MARVYADVAKGSGNELRVHNLMNDQFTTGVVL